jgi:hypothetical protein
MPFLAAKIGTGKHLGFVLLSWAVLFLLAAWVLPPLDSRLQPNATGVLERPDRDDPSGPSCCDRRSGLRVSVLAETPDCP